MSSILKEAVRLSRLGFSIIWLHERSKAPIGRKWTEKPFATEDDLRDTYRDGYNIGVRCGAHSRIDEFYLAVIDVDIRDSAYRKEALERFEAIVGYPLEDFPTVISGSGGESRHFYALTEEPHRSRVLWHTEEFFVDENGKKHWCAEIEYIGTGKQVVLPPSIHPDTDKPYRWEREFSLDSWPLLDDDRLSGFLGDDGDDETQDAEDREPIGISLGEAREVLADLQDWANDHATWRDVGMALKHEFGDRTGWKLFDEWSRNGKGYDKSDNVAQWRGFKNERGHGKVKTMRSLLHERKNRDIMEMLEDDTDELRAMFDDIPVSERKRDHKIDKKRQRSSDPDMSILRQARYDAPPFPLDIFNAFWRREITAVAKNASAPVDFVAGSLLAMAGSLIGNSRWVEVHPGWREPPIIWAQIIGAPSSNKSPAMRPFMGVAAQIESRWEPEYKRREHQWAQEKKVADSKRKKWEAIVNKAIEAFEDGETPDIPDMPADAVAPPKPVTPRVTIGDSTLEALFEVVGGNPRGLLNFRDEMAAWYMNMSRYNDGSDRPAWLEAYGGSSYSIDRVKNDKPIRIKRLTVGILGGIQPERLLSITDDRDDGLQARFMPFWPEHVNIPANRGGATETYLGEGLRPLSELSMQYDHGGDPEPEYIPLSNKGLDIFFDWLDAHKVAENYVPARLKSAFGKAPGHVARMSLILEFLDWCSDFFADDEPSSIGTSAVKRAIRFREDYLKPMQMRVYGHSADTDEARLAKSIAEWIVNSETKRFNLRDLRRAGGIPGLSGRTDPQRSDHAIEYLMALNWLRQEEHEGSRRGRPAKTFIVNDRVWELLD